MAMIHFIDLLEVFAWIVQAGACGLVYWVYCVWNRRHEEIKECLACIDDLQARVLELEDQSV